MRRFSRILSHYPVIIYLALYITLIGAQLVLNPMPFYDWDESIYAQVGREMIAKPSLVPLWQGQIWLDKPPFAPLFYGAVQSVTPFIKPEISMRIATLLVSLAVYAMIYALYYRITKNSYLSTLVVVGTSTSQIFLQRSQLANIDIFLLFGWIGYILFYKKYWTSFIFLTVAVMSKSLIGFYPVGIMFLYFSYLKFISREISNKQYFGELKKMSSQTAILALWYAFMFVVYGKEFIDKHIIESHTKRVTASIESHFGKRTFYIDLLFEEYGKYAWSAVLGSLLIGYDFIKKNIKPVTLLYGFFLIPWFLFLNLTKTKIFWYGYPYIPQIMFLMIYPLWFLKRLMGEKIVSIISILIILFIFYTSFIQQKIQTQQFASYDDHHKVAEYAKKSECSTLFVLIEPEGRVAAKTLSSMNLLISTSKWWGNHPSMVYYFGGPVNYIYTEKEWKIIIEKDKNLSRNCFVGTKEDQKLMTLLTLDRQIGIYFLYTNSSQMK